jgi:hypothetical protein
MAMGMMEALMAALLAVQAGNGAPAASAAVAGAEHWVRLVDGGEYGQSWSEAGTLLKSQVRQMDWTGMVEPARKPLGALVSRKLKDETATRSLPGAPDGDYDVVRFDTSFASGGARVETLVLAHEPTGWKVDGYFIK